MCSSVGRVTKFSAVRVTQPYRVASTNGTAQIQCVIQPRPAFHQVQPSHGRHQAYPYPTPEDFRVTLMKGLHGNQELCSSVLNFTEQIETQWERQGEVQCWAKVRDGAVEVTISGLKATDTDIYRCEIQVFYPPPFLRFRGNGTLLHVVESSDCPAQRAKAQRREEEDEEEDGERTAPLSVPVVVLVILIICVLLIIIYVQTLQCERGRREMVRMTLPLHHKTEATSFPYENI
ncbi:cytotoxic T-lymphocyte protein 4 isoform 2-T2 [Odontesthes bonariensis]|uniref:cytotoxic T-lymphocyte protein 4 isoform X2 n=1 Tax=Odontesthes bonariensis TaxID=219752 RepID=UPI003F582F6C